MITGFVHANEASIRLLVRGPNERDQEIDAIIDTGFTGALTLPPSLVAKLGLHWRKLDRGLLADGSECIFDVHEAEVVWDGSTKSILIDEADATPLVGMTLLDGYQLTMLVRSGGKVTIKPLLRRGRA